MQMNKGKTITICISMLLLLLMSNLFVHPVNADEDDLSVSEGDKFTWKITKIDKEKAHLSFLYSNAPAYSKEDTLIWEIEATQYLEDGEYWVIHCKSLNFDQEDDDLYGYSQHSIYKNGSDQPYYNLMIIPNDDVEQYLIDVASQTSSFESDGNELMINYSDYEITYLFNNDGILEKYTEEYDGDTLLEYELAEETAAIPFGFEFLIFIPVGLLVSLYLIKKKAVIKGEK